MVFGITSGGPGKKFSVKNLEPNEHMVEFYYTTISAGQGPLKRHLPDRTPKEWKDDSSWKKVKEYFCALTNKRWLFVNYKNQEIIESYDLSKFDVLGGNERITFMNGTDRYKDVELGDCRAAFQTIKHIQSLLSGATESKNDSTPSIQQSSEDPLSILKIRFVKGEISKETYEEMKEMLEQ